jgi:hypothetical protein
MSQSRDNQSPEDQGESLAQKASPVLEKDNSAGSVIWIAIDAIAAAVAVAFTILLLQEVLPFLS